MKVHDGELRHFCDDPVCPDPVWKPSSDFPPSRGYKCDETALHYGVVLRSCARPAAKHLSRPPKFLLPGYSFFACMFPYFLPPGEILKSGVGHKFWGSNKARQARRCLPEEWKDAVRPLRAVRACVARIPGSRHDGIHVRTLLPLGFAPDSEIQHTMCFYICANMTNTFIIQLSRFAKRLGNVDASNPNSSQHLTNSD